MSKLVKQVFTEQIYHLLRNDILSQSIACSQKLNIRELQEKYGVSGSPVREAISRLHQEGLVEYLPNVGTKVIKFKKDDVIELLDMHKMLDCNALKLALNRHGHQVVAAQLQPYIEQIQSLPMEGKLEAADQFQNTVYLLAANKRLQKMRQQVEGQVQILRSVYSHSFNSQIDYAEYIGIYNAIVTGDTQQAIVYWEEHYDHVLERLLKNDEKENTGLEVDGK